MFFRSIEIVHCGVLRGENIPTERNAHQRQERHTKMYRQIMNVKTGKALSGITSTNSEKEYAKRNPSYSTMMWKSVGQSDLVMDAKKKKKKNIKNKGKKEKMEHSLNNEINQHHEKFMRIIIEDHIMMGRVEYIINKEEQQ